MSNSRKSKTTKSAISVKATERDAYEIKEYNSESFSLKIGKWNFKSPAIILINLYLVSIFLIAGAFKIGVPADEPIDYTYGKNSLKYFLTLGKDTSYAQVTYHRFSFPDQKYYGAAFEMIAPAINSLIKPQNLFIVHHILAAFSGALLILFTGLIAVRIQGIGAGVLAR